MQSGVREEREIFIYFLIIIIRKFMGEWTGVGRWFLGRRA